MSQNLISLFDKRKIEWDSNLIKTQIDDIFKKVDVLEGWSFKESNWDTPELRKKEELKNHLYKTLKVQLNEHTKKGEVKKEHIYNIQVPVLVKDQFFYLSGLYKIPVFQLYDFPVIFKNDNKFLLKFKNNVVSYKINKTKKGYTCDLFFNHMKINKNIPLELIICSLYDKNDFDLFYNTLDNKNEILKTIYKKCENLWNTTTQKDKLIEALGEYRLVGTQTSDNFKKGNSILFSLKFASEMDFHTSKFMQTNCIIKESLKIISDGPTEENSIFNKRLRLSEYILAELVKNVYNMICTLNYNKKIKYKIVQTTLMDSCNVSSIVHFNFPYNPIGEVTSLLQCTLSGPNSFKKTNVPSYLKNIDDSQMGYICPIDTPDRDGAGVVLNLPPDLYINEDGTFNPDAKSKFGCSYPISLIPFMNNNDQTRLQMASSQYKQAISIVNPDKAMVVTGDENKYLEHSTFKEIAKENGKVLYVDSYTMVIRYKSGEIETFDLGYRSLYLNSTDHLYTTLKRGNRFKKGDILVISKFLDEEHNISTGKNLLTAVMIGRGYNYEDGIIISEKVQQYFTSSHIADLSIYIEPGHVLLSLDDSEYKPLPEVGELIKKGDVYCKIKQIHENNCEYINIDPKEHIAQQDCIITNIEIYPNTWNKQIPQFNEYVEKLIEGQNNKVNEIKTILEKYFDKEKTLNKYLKDNNISKLKYNANKGLKYKYMEKGSNIKGIQINIQAVFISETSLGDKISNRHAAKGVVSKIVPENEMPLLKDGRRVEIIVNPLGVISRMNLGQLFELHVTESLYNLKNMLRSHIEFDNNNKLKNKRKILNTLKEYLLIIYKNEDNINYKHILEKFKESYSDDVENSINNIQLIFPTYEGIHPKQLNELMEYTNSKYKYELFDPEINRNIKREIACGYMYFNKLIHRAEEKMMARSIGPYNKSTLQPLSGKKRLGAHRLGEMECWAILAHGAEDTLKELITTHSDSPAKKNKVLSKILQNDEMISDMNNIEDEQTRSSQLLQSYLKVIGLEIEF